MQCTHDAEKRGPFSQRVRWIAGLVRLMNVHGLPSRMLQAFFDSMDQGSFGRDEVENGKTWHKILLPEMLDGYFIALVNDPPNDGVFQFYATEEKFLLGVRILALEGNNVPQWVPFSLGDTAREAMGRIDAWHSRQEYVTASPGEYARKALERVELLARTTQDSYDSIIGKYLKPSFGAACLRDLSPLTLQRYFSAMTSQGIAYPSVLKIRDALSSILRSALQYERLAVNRPGGGPQKFGSLGCLREP